MPSVIAHETDRLALMNWKLEDFNDFAQIARDPRVMRYIADGQPWPDSRIGWFMGLQRAFQYSLGYCCWKLVEKDTLEFIGFCGIAPSLSLNEIEIGWWLKPSHWGQGFAFEAASHVEKVSCSEHGIGRIIARVYEGNAASVRLVEKLGMAFVRNLETTPVGSVLLYEKRTS